MASIAYLDPSSHNMVDRFHHYLRTEKFECTVTEVDSVKRKLRDIDFDMPGPDMFDSDYIDNVRVSVALALSVKDECLRNIHQHGLGDILAAGLTPPNERTPHPEVFELDGNRRLGVWR